MSQDQFQSKDANVDHERIVKDFPQLLEQDSPFWRPVSNFSIYFDKESGITTSTTDRATRTISSSNLKGHSFCDCDESLDSELASLEDNVLKQEHSQQLQKDTTLLSTWTLTGSTIENLCKETHISSGILISSTQFAQHSTQSESHCPETQQQILSLSLQSTCRDEQFSHIAVLDTQVPPSLSSSFDHDDSNSEMVVSTQKVTVSQNVNRIVDRPLSDDLISTDEDLEIENEYSISNTMERLSLYADTQDLFSPQYHKDTKKYKHFECTDRRISFAQEPQIFPFTSNKSNQSYEQSIKNEPSHSILSKLSINNDNRTAKVSDSLTKCLLSDRKESKKQRDNEPKDTGSSKDYFLMINLDHSLDEAIIILEGRVTCKGISWVRSRHQPWMFVPTCVLESGAKKTRSRKWVDCLSLRSYHMIKIEYTCPREYSFSLEDGYNSTSSYGRLNTRSCSQDQCIPCVIDPGQQVFGKNPSSKQWMRATIVEAMILLDRKHNRENKCYLVAINKIFVRIRTDSGGSCTSGSSVISFRDLGLELGH